MRVFGAMLLDSYRELNSKKLFWVILAISGIVILNFASIGFNDDGMSLFFGLKSIENPMLSKDSPLASMLYRSLFTSFIVGIWLAWIATILALMSTSTIFPDFIADGAIDTVLAKPIARVSLFAMKYATSLLFVVLQVSLFCLGIFLCLGARLGDWEWRIFAAIPVITLFYSYLFAVNVLFGVLTRSALTALLVTGLFWGSLFSMNASVVIMDQFRTGFTVQIEESDRDIATYQGTLDAMNERDEENPDSANDAARTRLEDRIASLTIERDDQQETIDKLDRWYKPIQAFQVIMPKTSETVGLLDRWLRRDTDVNIMDIFAGNVEQDGEGDFRTTDSSRDREVQRRMENEFESRSLWYVVGTSLVFEGVLLSLACWIFVRRDY